MLQGGGEHRTTHTRAPETEPQAYLELLPQSVEGHSAVPEELLLTRLHGHGVPLLQGRDLSLVVVEEGSVALLMPCRGLLERLRQDLRVRNEARPRSPEARRRLVYLPVPDGKPRRYECLEGD